VLGTESSKVANGGSEEPHAVTTEPGRFLSQNPQSNGYGPGTFLDSLLAANEPAPAI
jgi:hypothetical protein